MICWSAGQGAGLRFYSLLSENSLCPAARSLAPWCQGGLPVWAAIWESLARPEMKTVTCNPRTQGRAARTLCRGGCREHPRVRHQAPTSGCCFDKDDHSPSLGPVWGRGSRGSPLSGRALSRCLSCTCPSCPLCRRHSLPDRPTLPCSPRLSCTHSRRKTEPRSVRKLRDAAHTPSSPAAEAGTAALPTALLLLVPEVSPGPPQALPALRIRRGRRGRSEPTDFM